MINNSNNNNNVFTMTSMHISTYYMTNLIYMGTCYV